MRSLQDILRWSIWSELVWLVEESASVTHKSKGGSDEDGEQHNGTG